MTERIEKIDEQHDGLAIEFFKLDDRFAHRIIVIRQGHEVPALQSVEAQDGEWPASPPFQQMAVESRPGGPVAMALGMAGQSHWSAVFRFLPDHCTAEIEIACRTPAPQPPLSSRYQLLQGGLAGLAPGSLTLDVDHARLVLSSDRIAEMTVAYEESRTIVDLLPAELEPNDHTWQWSYQITRSGAE